LAYGSELRFEPGPPGLESSALTTTPTSLDRCFLVLPRRAKLSPRSIHAEVRMLSSDEVERLMTLILMLAIQISSVAPERIFSTLRR
jgi:hypothetical protein